MAAKKEIEVIEIKQVERQKITICLIGLTGLVQNSMNTHGIHTFLYPEKKDNKKELGLKHDPLKEFRSSIHRSPDPNSKTLIVTPGDAWKKSLAHAALDVGGVTKSQMDRLCYVADYKVPIWGKPFPFMAVVKQKGIGGTPDIRTRAIIPEWAAVVQIYYLTQNIKAQGIASLLNAAGLIQGMGDGRPQRGGSNGMYRVCEPKDPDFIRICKTQGRKCQAAAMNKLHWHDPESKELFDWFLAEAKERGDKVTRR